MIDELLAVVRRFGQEHVAPAVAAYDRDERFPSELLPKMAELGFFGGTVPERWGGTGLTHAEFSSVIEEISRFDHILGVVMSMPSALVGGGILAYGANEQRERWLRPLAQGAIFGGAGVTEPRSGSDVAGMDTTYHRNGDGYVINGAKTWISNLDIASFFVTFATKDKSLGRAGVTAFIVPADAEGLEKNPFHNKLGFRPLATGELVLRNVYVGPESVIGEEGAGYEVAMTQVERGRLAVASRAVGLAAACLEHAAAYATERIVFGQPIADFQMVQKKLADMSVEIEAARLLTRQCAQVLDSGARGRREASMAKLYASDVAQRAATEALQIHGAYGVSDEYPVARLYRDAKVFQIVEGANDVHRALLAGYALGRRKD